MMTSIACIVGLILGILMILTAIFVLIKIKKFNYGIVVMVLGAIILLGFPLWTSFEISGDKFSLKFKTILGADKAEFNLKMQEIKRFVKLEIRRALTRRIKSATHRQISLPDEERFRSNSGYMVLVFHKPDRRLAAKKIERALVSFGFASAGIASDLRESGPSLAAGNARVIYNKRGKAKWPVVKSILERIKSGLKLHVRPSPVSLIRGDIQLMIY